MTEIRDCLPWTGGTGEDLSIVLSGGATNASPAKSLGGPPSDRLVGTGGGNLFGRVGTDRLRVGGADYRCVYLFNDSGTGVFRNVRVWVDVAAEKATVTLGVPVRNAAQWLAVTGTPTGGSFSLVYDATEAGGLVVKETDPVPWSADGVAVAAGMTEALAGVGVEATVAFDGAGFVVTFTGGDGGRVQPPLGVSNSVAGAAWQVGEIVRGSPINTVAPNIGHESVPPTGVAFVPVTATSPVVVPELRPLDSFPIWVRRVTARNTGSYESDGFALRVTADTGDEV